MHLDPTYAFIHSDLPATISPMDDPSDLRAWIDSRSEAAFTRIVARHEPMVQATCRRELGTASDADDATQAVFLICARRAQTVAPPQHLGAWLFGVAIRVCRTARRTAARRRRHELAARTVTSLNSHCFHYG